MAAVRSFLSANRNTTAADDATHEGRLCGMRRIGSIRRWAATCGVAGALAAAVPAVAAEDALTLAVKVDALARPLIESRSVVGMSVGLIVGETVVMRGYGETAIGSGVKPDERTVYEIGSISKAFTGDLLADAVLGGLVKLDEPVANYWGDGVKLPTRGGRAITLHDLATHTSGLPRMPGNFAPADPDNPYADYMDVRMFSFLASYELPRDIGSKREYSNLGFALLGQTLAHVRGTTYEKLLVDRIAGPLHMDDTRIVLTDAMRQRLAPGYTADLESAANWDLPTFAGAGGIRSTVSDMLRWLRAHAEATNDGGELAKAMTLAMAERYADGDGGMGLGWHVSRDRVARFHSGQTGGYHTMAMVVRDAAADGTTKPHGPPPGVAVIVLSNTATGVVSGFANQIVLTALGIEQKPMDLPKAADVPAATLDRYVGRYAMTEAFVLTVERRGGRLFVTATGQPGAYVYPTSDRRFVYRVVDAAITFDEPPALPEVGGPSPGLTLHQHGLDMRARRVAGEGK